ncbi:MAG: hypothetical protein CFE21_10295 [Bacteroidetes bacterium B1(2017)]|nr:MAG: hypothetical protein CFE21_10295 [Bacteroidetes bacterium B1(2017)]
MKKLFVLAAGFILAMGSLIAQSPVERKKIQKQQAATEAIQEQSDEKDANMKLSTSEQRKDRKEQAEFETALKGYESDFERTKAPEQFKNNSAIILAQSIYFDFTPGYNKGLYEKRIIRRRVLIQDKSALEAFSIFYTRPDATYKLSITKPDNTKREISKKAALTEDAKNIDIPNFFVEFIGGTKNVTKLPVQGLEIGDILEIQQAVEISNGEHYTPFIVAPVVEVLSNNYPIVIQRFGILVPKNYYIQLFCLNGTPKPEINSKSDGSRLYLITDSMHSASNREYYNYVFRSSPVFKFQISFKSKENNIDDNYNSPLNQDEVLKLAFQEISPDEAYQWKLKKATIKYVKSLKLLPNQQEEIVRQAYYFLRTVTLVKLSNKESNIIFNYYPKMVKNGALEGLDEVLFLNIMQGVLDEFNIEYIGIVGVSKKYGLVKDAIHKIELEKGIKVLGNKPIYIFNLNQHSYFNEIYPHWEGTDVLVYSKSKDIKKEGYDISNERIPESKLEDNYVKEISTVKVSENFENLLLQKRIEAKGNPRYDYYDDVLLMRDFVTSDLEKIGRKGENDEEFYKNEVRQAAFLKTKQEQKEKLMKDCLANLKKMFEGQKFEVKKVSDFELVSDGRYDESPILEFKVNTEFKNLIAPAGPNYLVSVGTLIGSQLELKPEDMKRDFDIYQNYRRHFVDEINFEIPEGYTVEDPNSLKMNVDNESASFVAEVEVKGNLLHFKTTKTYKNLYDTKSKWENYTKVLDAAYEFHQKKIVLKKKG